MSVTPGAWEGAGTRAAGFLRGAMPDVKIVQQAAGALARGGEVIP